MDIKMDMDTNKQPGIKILDIILTTLEFSRDNNLTYSPKLKIEFSQLNSLSEDKENLSTELTCFATDEEKTFSIKCSMVGIFASEPETKNLSLEDFAKVNAPTIIFPFIREIISSTTRKAGLPPVILPPMNIPLLVKQGKENSK